MKKLLKISVCTFGIALLTLLPARAQRTAYGERLITVSAHYAQFWGTSAGLEVSFGQYLLQGYWFSAANFTNRVEIDNASQEVVNYPRLQGMGGYMQRLYGSRERELNVYGGGDVFLGVEMFDLYQKLTAPTKQALYKNGVSDYRFLYGLSPRAEVEYFPLSNIAIVAKFRLPVCFNSNTSVLGVEFGIGARFNF